MQPTLLRDYQGQDIKGWLMSEKLDGWRLMWTGEEYILRGGGILRVPDAWKIGMPGFALDGELFAGRGEFNRIQRMIAGGCDGLQFAVFDAPEHGGVFRDRLEFVLSLPLPDHCRRVPHARCKGTEHMIEFADNIVSQGGEGVVVRNPRAIYQPGRTTDVLRWVPQCPTKNRAA